MIAVIRKVLRKVVPEYAIFPLLLTALSILCSYQGAKLWQILFGFHAPLDLTTPFDLQTPFLPEWAWMYIASYLIWIYVYTTAARDSKEAACKLAVADFTGKLICLLFFLLLPTTNIRPEVSGHSLPHFLMRTIYALDTPTNLFPSVHCFIVWLGTRCIVSAKNLKHKGFHCTASIIGTILVFASTLFTKQHVVADILGAIAVAEISLMIPRFSPLLPLVEGWNEAFMKTKLYKFL